MTRILLTMVLPLLAPTFIYIGYLVVAHWYSRRPGGAARPFPGFQTWPWLWLALAGAALAAASFVFLAETTTEPPGGVYVPPQYIDGEIVPGHVIREGEEGAE